jgi:acetoin utilization deacetylase AcuC-like enzyme
MFTLVHHPLYVAPASKDSRYRWNKNGLVRDVLLESGAAIEWIEPEPMPRRWIEAVHHPDYVAQVLSARVPAEKERRIGFPVTETVALRAMHVPGGTYAAAMTSLARGFAFNNAGGSHHALEESGAGYCVFNDLAIAAARLVREGQAERVLIVDCDVHQGDGTATLTRTRDAIATYSIHAEKNFPVRKARSSLDVPLPDGTGDAAYLEALETSLVPLVDAFRPSIILYQAGVDPFAGDRLGRLSLSQEGLGARDILVGALARDRGIPLAGTLGGGYGADPMEVAGRHARTILTLAGVFAPA